MARQIDNVTDSDFATWLQMQLDQRGLNMHRLATRAGLNAGTLSRLMSGATPGLEACRALAGALAVPFAVVLTEAGHLPRPPAYDAEAEEALALFRQLDRRERAVALSMLHTLALPAETGQPGLVQAQAGRPSARNSHG